MASDAVAPPPYTSLLEEALEAWQYTREGVTQELDNIPAESFDFRPTPASRTVADLARHIAEAGLMAVGELTRPGGDFTRQGYTEFLREYASGVARVDGKPELIGLLRDSWREGDRRFREAGELVMLQYIRRFDGQPGTRFAWFQHHISHEEYHRGQLALYARLLGLTPALTLLIEASG